MSFTNFPNGVSSLGVPVMSPYGVMHTGGRVPNGGSTLSANKHFWVHGSLGGDGNNGLSPDKPFLTMAAAFAQVGSGDIIHLNGKVTEQLVTPAGVFDVTVIGEGTRPRHPDAHTSSNGYSGARWSGSGLTAAQANVRVIQQGWRFVNVLFDAVDANAACIELVRNALSGDSEWDASHTEILGCRFSGAGKGIRSGATGLAEVVNHVLIDGNRFDNMTYGIHVAVISNFWVITNNVFQLNTNNVVADLGYAAIHNNTFGKFTTASLDLAGSSAAVNIISGNTFSGVYGSGTGYVSSNTTDFWAGNWCAPVATIAPDGFTILIPA